ncbi:MAG: molybdate ABC transporter substrate-binding protein [bacterium]|nr:molybdate ABC transporter substrate-binding protein [bacterium]
MKRFHKQNRHFTRRLSSLLALSIAALSILSGCGSTQSNVSESSTVASSAESSEATTSSEKTESQTASSTVSDEEELTLTVFAAASMTETLTEIAQLYEAEHSNVSIEFNFDSSGTLKTQIEEGAVCDVFLSAAQKQMDQIDISASPEVNTAGLDFVEPDTRFDLVENKVALAVPEGNPANILSFSDIGSDKCHLIALGNEDVPVGAYSIEILEYLGILDELTASNKITYGSNVKEVTTQVSEGAVDCGIIYATDAYSAGLTVVDTATADMCKQVIYPAAVLNTSEHKEEAKRFLDFLKDNEEAKAIFESVGFSMAE